MDKKIVAFSTGLVCVGVLIGALAMYSFSPHIHYFFGDVGVDFETWSIHSRVRFFKDGECILDEYNAGAVTDIGDNMTLAWIFGDSSYNVTEYLYNCTYISIGNQSADLTTTSVVLPEEWNRTLATVEDQSQSWLNLTCTFHPGAGDYVADCIGLNWRDTIASSGNLWAYDTFTEVTGIDSTFTIFEPSLGSDV